MKILYCTLIFSFCFKFTQAQYKQIQTKSGLNKPADSHMQIDLIKNSFHRKQSTKVLPPLRIAASCGVDTVQYCFFKNASNRNDGINYFPIRNASNFFSVVGQYFSCPQPITISGFYFFATKLDTTSNAPLNVTCNIFTASTDTSIGVRLGGTQLELPKATVIVPVDSAGIGGRFFSSLRKAVFPTPITLTQPYFVAISNNSATFPVFVVTNDYSDYDLTTNRDTIDRIPDGQKEWLMAFAGRIGNPAQLVSINAREYPLDGDLFVLPFVNYDINSDFTVNKTSASVGEPITFTNTSSPILFDRFYNVAPLLDGNPAESFLWDFDGPLPVEKIGEKTFIRSFAAPGVYNVSLLDSLYTYNYITTDGLTPCASNIKTVPITITAAQGVAKAFDNQNIQVYPNPAEEELYITTELSGYRAYDAVLTDVAGKTVLQQPLSLTGQATLPLNGIQPGIYTLRLTGSDESIVKQIIVK